jgi:hypothetical protein
VQQHQGKLYWDPGNPKVREYLKELISEIMSKYDLDGAHIDDYFYPSGLRASAQQVEKKGNEAVWNDELLYKQYGGGMELHAWRESNINAIVKTLHSAVKAVKPNATFGVSPAGRLENTRNLYADPVQWAKEGSIDYLIPQIYWPHGHKIADFKKVLDSWNGILQDVPVIVGVAAYRFGQKGFENMSEYKQQIQECRQAPYNVIGHCWFTTHDIITDQFTSYILNNAYQLDALAPNLLVNQRTMAAPEVFVALKKIIRWSEVSGAKYYAVYKLVDSGKISKKGGKIWNAELVKKFKGFNFSKIEPQTNYFVIAGIGNNKSERSNIIYIK